MKKLLATVIALAVSTTQADTIFVDDDAPLGGDGLSWNSAYRFLQDAIFDAASDLTINEIRVAQGTYTPDLDEAGAVTPGDRAATFNPLSGVSMLGGFAGLGAVDPDDRNVVQYTTVLDGDLDGDDGPVGSFVNNAENSRNVVTADGTDPSAVLDGFTVTGGNADGPNDQDNPDLFHLARGGGIWNANGSPTVRNCRIEFNTVLMRGGGMYNLTGTSPVVTGCMFRGNVVTSAEGNGGGLRNFQSNATVTDCVFVDNSSGTGGGMDNSLSTAVVTRCTFSGNLATDRGGGMSILGGTATVTDCTFSGNSANRGGGMFNDGNATVTNCTFTVNQAAVFGGGMFIFVGSNATVTNCTFSGNSANLLAGGMFAESGTTVTNCILWDDSPDEFGEDTPSINYSDVQGISGGIGNIDANPLFVDGPSGTWTDPGVYDLAAGVSTFTDTNASFVPDGLVGGFLVPLTLLPTERPIVANTATTISVLSDAAFMGVPGLGYQVNDYRLTTASPCIDAGDNTALPEDITTDLDGNPRFLEIPETPDTGNPPDGGPIVDMGAYESLGGGCLAVTSQEIVCHADGATFTVNIEGLNACTGGTTQVTFTASGGAVGEELCFTAIVNDGGFCCTTQICVTIPDCTSAALPSDLDGDGIVGMVDFLALLAAWGSCSDCGTPEACPADFDGDCSVGIGDLLILLENWS